MTSILTTKLIIMYALLIASAAAFMYFKAKKQMLLATILKGMSTWIIIGGALFLTLGSSLSLFTILIVAALAMGLAGDVSLSLPGHGLMAGMLFFGLGHISAVVAMAYVLGSTALITIPIAVALFFLLFFIQRKLGVSPPQKLKIPVLAYSAIISCMLSVALTVPFFIFPNGLILLFAGLVFTVSDLALAINSFAKKDNDEKAEPSASESAPVAASSTVFSLSCYFLGQSLFAVSVYFFG
ncbi:MAG: lysoplasmalogenase [Oscillospiraceae bacterium]|nr:lysoplasmalogenase [Oscillospiraceae bacterium]